MATINLAIETALRGLIANQTAIDTTAHNIANMNNINYSRQIADITATQPFTDNNVQVGTGSYVSDIERIRDIYLDKQIWSELQNQGKWSVIDSTMQSLETIFPEVENASAPGINAQLTAFWNAWATLAANPGNTADQNAVYNTAQNLSDLFNQTSSALTGLQLDLNQQMRDTLNTINNYLSQIAELNKQIVIVKGLGQQPNDLMDQMDGILNQLSQLINVNVVNMPDGSIGVFLQGIPLVSETDYRQFSAVAGKKDSKLEDVGLDEYVGASPVDVTSMIQSGELGGILQSRDNEITTFKNQLDNLASSLITVVNEFESAEPASALGTYTNFFVGSDAASIGVNPALQNGANILTTSNQGNVATLITNLQDKLLNNFIMSDPNLQIKGVTSATKIGTNGQLILSDGSNVNTVTFNSGETIAQLIQAINVNATTYSAIFNDKTQQFFMVSDGPMTMEEFDNGGPGTAVMSLLNLVETQVSAAPTNYNIGSLSKSQMLYGGVIPASPPIPALPATWLNQIKNLNSPISTLGTVNLVKGGVSTSINWTENQTLNFTAAIIAAAGLTFGSFSQNDQKFHFETTPNGNTISPFNIVDQNGNLTTVMRLTGNLNFGDAYNALIGEVSADATGADNMLSEYNSAVSQLQTLQNNIKAVNEQQEEMLAAEYQNAYDASTKVLGIIDEMMTTLINIGVPSSSSSAAVSL